MLVLVPDKPMIRIVNRFHFMKRELSSSENVMGMYLDEKFTRKRHREAIKNKLLELIKSSLFWLETDYDMISFWNVRTFPENDIEGPHNACFQFQ